MVGAGVLVPDEALEEEVRRIGRLPEKVETAVPPGAQPGENGPGEDELESKTIYKVTSILDNYQRGKLTRKAAARLLDSLTLNEEQVNFYLDEADISRKEQEKAEAAEEKAKAADDEKDAKEAEEAKKSLGR